MDDPREPRRRRGPGVIWVPEPAPLADPGARPDTGNAWGRTEFLEAPGGIAAPAIEMARVQLDVSQPLQLSADVLQWPDLTSGGPIDDFPAVWLLVDFGSGSTGGAQRKVQVIDRIDVAIVASWFRVQAYLGRITDGAPINNPGGTYTSAQLSLQISRGVRPQSVFAPMFNSGVGQIVPVPGGFASQLLVGAFQMLSVSAHLSASTSGQETFLQLFDMSSAPAALTTPNVEYALGTLPEHSGGVGGSRDRFFNPRPFANGLYAALSTTSGALTLAANTSRAILDIETLQL